MNYGRTKQCTAAADVRRRSERDRRIRGGEVGEKKQRESEGRKEGRKGKEMKGR